MATGTAKKPRRKARQTKLPGVDDVEGNIKELNDLGDELDEVRTERLSCQAAEKEVQDRLIECMKKHDLKTYKYEGKALVLQHDEVDKVKVKKAKVESDDGRDFGGE